MVILHLHPLSGQERVRPSLRGLCLLEWRLERAVSGGPTPDVLDRYTQGWLLNVSGAAKLYSSVLLPVCIRYYIRHESIPFVVNEH